MCFWNFPWAAMKHSQSGEYWPCTRWRLIFSSLQLHCWWNIPEMECDSEGKEHKKAICCRLQEEQCRLFDNTKPRTAKDCPTGWLLWMPDGLYVDQTVPAFVENNSPLHITNSTSVASWFHQMTGVFALFVLHGCNAWPNFPQPQASGQVNHCFANVSSAAGQHFWTRSCVLFLDKALPAPCFGSFLTWHNPCPSPNIRILGASPVCGREGVQQDSRRCQVNRQWPLIDSFPWIPLRGASKHCHCPKHPDVCHGWSRKTPRKFRSRTPWLHTASQKHVSLVTCSQGHMLSDLYRVSKMKWDGQLKHRLSLWMENAEIAWLSPSWTSAVQRVLFPTFSSNKYTARAHLCLPLWLRIYCVLVFTFNASTTGFISELPLSLAEGDFNSSSVEYSSLIIPRFVWWHSLPCAAICSQSLLGIPRVQPTSFPHAAYTFQFNWFWDSLTVLNRNLKVTRFWLQLCNWLHCLSWKWNWCFSNYAH